MSHSWLQKKRKGDLLELAQRANVSNADTLLKDDLVAALEATLEENEALFSKQPAFTEYYGLNRSASPIKRERYSPEALASTSTAVSRTRRRQTLVKTQDADDYTPERTALVSRTPRPVSHAARRISEVEIPASPAQLADVADQSLQAVKVKATELWDKSRVDEWKDCIRRNVSSVSAIQTLILFVEATGLQYNTLTTFHAFDTPPNVPLSIRSRDIHIPDPTVLLKSDWWAPATLWSLTSWILPLVASYFFNLTLRTNTLHKSSNRVSRVDPLTFNIVKALLAYSAYNIVTQADAALAGRPNTVQAQNLGWLMFTEPTVSTVRDNVPGGYYGLQIGAVVGVLFSLYDAALRK